MLPANGVVAPKEGSVWLRPWRVLLLSLGAVVVGTLLSSYDDALVTPIRLLLMLAGLIVGGWAVQRRLGESSEDLDERVESAGLVAIYSLEGLIGYLGMAEPWFSGRIFFTFFIVATIIGSLLVLMPRLWRRLTIIAIICFHFVGIVTVSTTLPASNGQTAWLPTQLFVHVYRPYLTGLYLTNGYHFYSPDPGSSTLVWLRIEYDDGTYKWIKLPNRDKAETPLHYQREMGMCEGTSSRAPQLSPVMFKARLERRYAAAAWPEGGRAPIPMVSNLLEYNQYNEPSIYSKTIMKSMARHACHYYPNESNPSSQAKFIKIYRLTYTIIMPTALLHGGDPLDDNLKVPFFMGEFNNEGVLVRRDDTGKVIEEGDLVAVGDPFIYWAIPLSSLPNHAGDVKVVKAEEK